MMKLSAWITTLAILTIWIPTPLLAGESSTDKISWTTYTQALAADEDGRKFFLYFYTDQCRACVMLKKNTFSDSEVIDYINDNYIPIKIDAAKEAKLASRFGIQGVPDLRFMTPQGEEISRWLGFIESKRLHMLLQYIDTDSYKEISYHQFVKNQKKQ